MTFAVTFIDFKYFKYCSPSTTDNKNVNGKIKRNHEIVEENILSLHNDDSKKLSSNAKEKKKSKHKSKDKNREHRKKKSRAEDKERPTELDLLGISPPQSKTSDAEKDTINKYQKKSKKHHRKDNIKASEYEEALGISTPSKEIL